MGGKTAAQWLAIFQDKNRSWAERWQAIEAIGYLGPAAKIVVPSLIRAVDPAKTGDGKLDQVNESLRQFAAQALGRIGPAAAEAIPKLFPKTGDQRFETRHRTQLDSFIAEALGRIGKPSLPALLQAFQGKDLELRIFATLALAAMQDEAGSTVPVLIAALNEPTSALQDHVVKALGRIGPAAAPAVPVLKTKLGREDYDEREIFLAFERIGKASVPALVEIFQQGVREFLQPESMAPHVEVFLHLGTEAREAAPALLPYLTDQRPMIRAAAAVALGAVEPETPGVIPALIEILKYPSFDPKHADGETPEQLAKEQFERYAVLILRWIGPPAQRPASLARESEGAGSGLGLVFRQSPFSGPDPHHHPD